MVHMNTLPKPWEFGATLPRMVIDHKSGTYRINDADLSDEQLKTMILLGAVRQRVMFSDAGSSVMECRSLDFEHGMPTHSFPTDRSNFPASHVEEAKQGKHNLSCGSCAFKNWEEVPTDFGRTQKVRPKCMVQVVVPLLVMSDSGKYGPAVVTYQKSSERPITEYMRTFKKRGTPAYTKISELRLNVNLASSGFRYSTPVFKASVDIDEALHPALSLIYRHMLGIIQTPPPPPAPRTGGMLSVGPPTAAPTYSGGFFS